MKQNFIVIFSGVILVTCGTKEKSRSENTFLSQTKEIQISIDTLDVSIKGDLRKVILFRDNFYGMFETSRKNTSERFKKMIVFDKKGEFIEDVFVPTKIQEMSHYDLIVDSERLYVKESQFEKINLTLGEYVADFKLSPTKDFPIFKDNNYDIYSSCNGEFGGTIYFKSKQTGKGFETASTCSIVVNKIGTEYYVTNYLGHMIGFASVLKISNPDKLEKSDLNFNTHQGSAFDKGAEVLIDTANFYIATSFVSDKRLLNLYSNEQGTYIGQIENKKMKQVYKFEFNFSADFNQQLDDGKQILTCHFPDRKSGILIIDRSNFTFYILK